MKTTKIRKPKLQHPKKAAVFCRPDQYPVLRHRAATKDGDLVLLCYANSIILTKGKPNSTAAYITHQILGMIDGFEEINRWASYHHEKINGQGYPFRIKGADLPLGSRIMAIADIFNALVENRPYRESLGRRRVEKILGDMAREGSIDGDIVQLLLDNYWEAAMLREKTMTASFAGGRPC